MKISGILESAGGLSLAPLQTLPGWAGRHKFLMAKITISLAMLLFFMRSSVNLTGVNLQPEEDFHCIYDISFKLSSPINRFLEANPLLKKALIVYSSVLMDLQFLFIMIAFCCLAKNVRFPLIFGSFYLLRGILQNLFIFSFPKDYIWGNPGIFSLTISYARTSDFFYSGHVGSSVLCVFEFARFEFFDKRFTYLKFFSLNCCITQCLVQIIFRGHYLIDVISGFVFAHYFYILVGEKVDNVEDDRKILLKDWKDTRRRSNGRQRNCGKCRKKED